MGELAGINRLEFIEHNGTSQLWQAVDVYSTNPIIATSVAMGMNIETIVDIDTKSIIFLARKVLDKNPDAKLLIIDLSKFPLIVCGIDKRDQHKIHENSQDKFSRDILKELDSKKRGIPTIIVNINIPFTGLKRIPVEDASESEFDSE